MVAASYSSNTAEILHLVVIWVCVPVLNYRFGGEGGVNTAKSEPIPLLIYIRRFPAKGYRAKLFCQLAVAVILTIWRGSIF